MSRTKSQVADSTGASVEQEGGVTQVDLLKIIQGLQSKIEQLEKKTNPETPIPGNYDEDEYENKTIRPDKYVNVISLDVYPLNLSTEGYGRGKIFRFSEFGEVKRIMFKFLADIVENHRNFVEQGRFYILNRAVIHELGLEEEYAKILTKEKIETILGSKDRDITLSLFQSATKAQQEVICQMLIDRRVSGEVIDLNIWDRIDRLSNSNLEERYKITRDYVESLKQQKEETK